MNRSRPRITWEDLGKGIIHYNIAFPLVVIVFMLIWIFNPSELWENDPA